MITLIAVPTVTIIVIAFVLTHVGQHPSHRSKRNV